MCGSVSGEREKRKNQRISMRIDLGLVFLHFIITTSTSDIVSVCTCGGERIRKCAVERESENGHEKS